MKEFDYELAKQGHPVCTNYNEQVRILEIDDDDYPQITCYVILSPKFKDKFLCSFYKNGECATNEDKPGLHLCMEEERDRLMRELENYEEI